MKLPRYRIRQKENLVNPEKIFRPVGAGENLLIFTYRGLTPTAKHFRPFGTFPLVDTGGFQTRGARLRKTTPREPRPHPTKYTSVHLRFPTQLT